MILWIILLLAIIASAAIFVIKNAAVRNIVGGILWLAVLGLTIVLTLNMHDHRGMEKKTVTTTTQVYSAAPAQLPVGMAAAKKIGANNYVLIYKDHASDQQASAHFAPDKSDIVKTVKQSATYEKANVTTAQVKTVTTKWVYKNDFNEWLFKQHKEDNLVKVRRTLQVPENWQVALK
ncbi:hypothetical protein R55227_BLOPHJLP_01133 [Fructobacillus tropaeoli]|uniref:DUF4811 domain-containing protein n=1 Tax=Fructobacillus tropaeoli TaxID=709323 RepID=UPI002D81EBEE|nr:hypothetical protein R55227_BLOPHJLP_01133 [Fructobacillus tropaeoli]